LNVAQVITGNHVQALKIRNESEHNALHNLRGQRATHQPGAHVPRQVDALVMPCFFH